MPSYITSESTEVLIGWKNISRHLGVCMSTVQKWKKEHGFPVGVLPDGRYATTKNLIEQWFIARAECVEEQQRKMLKTRLLSPVVGHEHVQSSTPTT